MSRTRKKYGTHTRQPGKVSQLRGGTPGGATDTGFGAKGNQRKAKKVYKTQKQSAS